MNEKNLKRKYTLAESSWHQDYEYLRIQSNDVDQMEVLNPIRIE